MVAKDRGAVERLALANGVSLTPEEWTEVIEYELAGVSDEKVFIFPEAGCC